MSEGARLTASRKSTFCTDAPTKRRTLRSPGRADCTFPSRCGVREVWANRPPGCGVPWKIAQLGKCVRATARQAAGRVAQGSANLSLGFDLTEKRTLAPIPHGKALFGETHKQNALFPSRYGYRMRLCVSLELQSASFRKTCFSSPGQMSGHFTEKRTLAAAPHGKAHFEPRLSRLETPRRCGRVHLDSFVQHD